VPEEEEEEEKEEEEEEEEKEKEEKEEDPAPLNKGALKRSVHIPPNYATRYMLMLQKTDREQT